MTGSVQIESLVQKLEKMIRDNKGPSRKNQEVLNDICKALVISQSKSLLEFIDIILERFMYPRDESKSLLNLLALHECAIIDEEKDDEEKETLNYEQFDLGHPRILEMILIRQKVAELKATGDEGWSFTEYTPKLLRKVDHVYLLLVHLLQVLSDHIEVPSQSAFYRNIVTDSICDFQTAFETFKSLDFIFHALWKSVEMFGISDDMIFHVDDILLTKIKKFTDNNLIWYEDLMTRSVALREFLLVRNRIYQNKKDTQLLEAGIESLALEVIYDTEFEEFLEKRKSRLNISNRKVF